MRPVCAYLEIFVARIAGVNIPTNKRVLIALQYIHGIGPAAAADIIGKVGIEDARRVNQLTDAEVLQILRHARAALPTGGRLYVVEMLVSEESVAGGLCDLHLLMATGGRERSAEHFGRLLTAAGFELAAVRRLPALPSVIVGVRL